MQDGELALRAIDGDNAAFTALAHRHRKLIHGIASRYYFAGADREDVHQEALLGLFHACEAFDFSGRAKFSTFAGLCIERYVITALKASQRLKHRALNESISLTAPTGDNDSTLTDVLPCNQPTTDELVEQRQQLAALVDRLPKQLTEIEQTVLARRLGGATLRESGDGLGWAQSPQKTADNALCRIRRKAHDVLQTEAA